MFQRRKALNFLYFLLAGILLFLFFYLLIKLFPLYGPVFSFIWKLLLPFLIAGFIAYLLFPVVAKLTEWHIHRGLAILIIYIVFFGGIALLFYLLYPAIVKQLNHLNENFPQFIAMYDNFIYQIYDYTSFLPDAVHDKIDHFIHSVENMLDNLLSNFVSGFMKIFDIIIILTVIPILVFYLIKDHKKIKTFFKKFIPAKFQNRTSKMVREVDKSLGGYIRGQLIVCLFVSLTSFIMLKFLGLPYALLLSLFIGITNIIPYFGPFIGAVPAVAVAFTQSGSMVIFAIISILAIQIIEGNLLSPYIVGKSIDVHPIAIIFVLLIGEGLFGVIGMILAVPFLTIGKVIVENLIAFSRDD